MPTTTPTAGSTEVKKRARRFASLRAAQRALSELAHPADLERALEHGSEILIQLRELGRGAAAGGAADAGELQAMDALLDELSASTRKLFENKPISQLRSCLQRHAANHPDETRGVIETLLEGDLERDANLRLLEYLITQLCSEERDGYRRVAREPSEAVPQLGALAEGLWGLTDASCRAARGTLSQATAGILGADAVGPTRDRVREFKSELGTRILHPAVISAALHYNVAMANRVAGLVAGGRSIDLLADEVLTAPGDDGELAQSSSVFDSQPFSRVVAALGARLKGEPADDELAARMVAGFEVGRLTPAEADAFESNGADQPSFLIRSAVALGLTTRHKVELEDFLRELGIDLSLLETQWSRELAREMTASAHKLLAERRYVDASRLLEIKGRNLSAASPVSPRRQAMAAPAVLAMQPATRHMGMAPSIVTMLGLGLALLLFAFAMPSLSGPKVYSSEELAEISSYLHEGYRSDGGLSRFVGTLNVGWDKLEPAERVAQTAEMGADLKTRGVESVLLLDRFDRVQAHYLGGRVVIPAGSKIVADRR